MLLFILVAALLTAFASLLLLYVSLSTGLGPWIAPMMVVALRFFISQRSQVALITITVSFGGTIATGIGFSITTLYFVDRPLWEWGIGHPWWSCSALGLLVLVGGVAGLLLARRCAPVLIADPDMSFPVASAVLSALDAKQQHSDRWAVGGGICVASIIGLIRTILNSVYSAYVMSAGWAVGYFVGSSLVVPMVLGFCAQQVIVHRLAYWLSVPSIEVTFALCSGLLLSGAIKSGDAMRQLVRPSFFSVSVTEAVATIAVIAMLLGPLLYHLVYCASRTGLATYGRYMTLLMLPLLCVPGVTAVHIVLVCTLIGVMGATVVDSVCAYKIAQRCGASERAVIGAQIIGVVSTALSVGLALWWLCTHFTIGLMPLIAHRGLSRALLMQTFQFNGWLVLVGGAAGFVLGRLQINSAMVFGGMIMPGGLVLSVGGGALVARFLGHTPTGSLFWTGVLAGDMLWMLVLAAATAIFW